MHAFSGLDAPPAVLTLLAHDIRWSIIRALVPSDYRVHELVARLHKPMNVISYHLRLLREAALVTERRSTADARDVYYHLDLTQLQTRYLAAGHEVVPALTASVASDAVSAPPTPRDPVRILFLCTHNSARSQLAEAITRHVGGPHLVVQSAGTEPAAVHPMALAVLAEKQIATSGLVPSHVTEVADQSFDYVITVCDRARETCPTFPGHPEMLHWSFPDPSLVADGPIAQRRAFEETASQLLTRIRFLMIMIDRTRRERNDA